MSMTPEATTSFVECFNEQHPIGTPVIVIKDLGERFETKIKHPAFMAPSGHAVVHVEGISGWYDLLRIIIIADPGRG